jgi:hypothetical protein
MNQSKKTGVKGKRISRSYCQSIIAEPEKVFYLLCPSKHAIWHEFEGYETHLIYSETDFLEHGCVFSTHKTTPKGTEETIWITTKYDKDNHVIEHVRFTPDSRVCIVNISVQPGDNRTSKVNITYTYTSISEKGNQFIDSFTEPAFLGVVKFWEESMNYYLKKGKKLKFSDFLNTNKSNLILSGDDE